MFGYVNVYKDELKIKDYNIYRAYYCGLCKMLGKNHNQLSRLTLSYDFTFLAILCDSLKEDKATIANVGCIKRIGKRQTVKKAYRLDFASDMNLLFTYLKLKDDIADSHSIKAALSALPFWARARKIKKRYPKLCYDVEVRLKRLSFLEKSDCDIIDKAAHEFASILEIIFESADVSLQKIGYDLGRLIYIMDACDDMDKDYQNGSYNPVCLQYEFNGEYTRQITESISNVLYNSLSSLAEQYERLDVKKNKPILDNIIYMGMRAKCDSIINERTHKYERPI